MRKIGVFLLVLIVLITPFSVALEYGMLSINNIIIPISQVKKEPSSIIYIYAKKYYHNFRIKGFYFVAYFYKTCYYNSVIC